MIRDNKRQKQEDDDAIPISAADDIKEDGCAFAADHQYALVYWLC